MRITEVRMRLKNREHSKIRAVASFTIDDCFVIHDIKVIEGSEGLFIAMPSRKATDGEYKDVSHPINTETREMLSDLILKEYFAAKENEQKSEEPLKNENQSEEYEIQSEDSETPAEELDN